MSTCLPCGLNDAAIRNGMERLVTARRMRTVNQLLPNVERAETSQEPLTGLGRGGGGDRERGARADLPEQVQAAEGEQQKGAEGRGKGRRGVGAGLCSRICARHLLAGSRRHRPSRRRPSSAGRT